MLLRLNGLSEPTKKEEDTLIKIIKDVVKPKAEWSDTEKRASQANAKALNTIFAGVDEEQFKVIST